MDPRYPIGRFHRPESISMADRVRYISEIAALPEQLKTAVAPLDDEQLDTPYRPGGWTVRQVVHHVADSHMNSYLRFKLALTEDEPLIKPYAEDQWAEIEEARRGPVGVSLTLLAALHNRWVQTLAGMNEADFQRAFRHPELGAVRLDMALALYAWHGKHHLGHIAQVTA